MTQNPAFLPVLPGPRAMNQQCCQARPSSLGIRGARGPLSGSVGPNHIPPPLAFQLSSSSLANFSEQRFSRSRRGKGPISLLLGHTLRCKTQERDKP